MALDIIAALTEELDSYTTCFVGNNETKQELNYLRMRTLIGKITQTASHKFKQEEYLNVIEAMRFAGSKHRGVYRKDNVTPYLLHVLEVAFLLLSFKVYDYKALIAAIIHDVIEDTETTKKEVAEKFGVMISRIVDLLTKHENFVRRKFYWRRMRNEKNLHILWRVIVIKFADRIHNLMTLDSVSPESRRSKIAETKEQFPKLYGVLILTFHRLRQKHIFTPDRYMHLPFHLNNRLIYEMGRY